MSSSEMKEGSRLPTSRHESPTRSFQRETMLRQSQEPCGKSDDHQEFHVTTSIADYESLPETPNREMSGKGKIKEIKNRRKARYFDCKNNSLAVELRFYDDLHESCGKLIIETRQMLGSAGHRYKQDKLRRILSIYKKQQD